MSLMCLRLVRVNSDGQLGGQHARRINLVATICFLGFCFHRFSCCMLHYLACGFEHRTSGSIKVSSLYHECPVAACPPSSEQTRAAFKWKLALFCYS